MNMIWNWKLPNQLINNKVIAKSSSSDAQILTDSRFSARGGTGSSQSHFQSWVSVLLFVIIVHFLRSIAAPFLNPKSEARWAHLGGLNARHFNLTAFLYCWLLSVTALTILPHFSSSNYKAIIAASIFFPAVLATAGVLMTGRLVIRVAYLARTRTVPWVVTRAVPSTTMSSNRVAAKAVLAGAFPGTEVHVGNGDVKTVLETAALDSSALGVSGSVRTTRTVVSSVAQADRPELVAFQRPFRALLLSSAKLSASLCLLHAHCWSSNLGAFRLSDPSSDGNGGGSVICRAASSAARLSSSSGDAAEDEFSILVIWAAMVLVMLYNYAREEFAGKHYVTTPKSRFSGANPVGGGDDLVVTLSDDWEDDMNHDEDIMTTSKAHEENVMVGSNGEVDSVSSALSMTHEDESNYPHGAMAMVNWYSFMLFMTCFDLLVQFLVFLGRYDARTMQPALDQTWPQKWRQKKSGAEDEGNDANVEGDASSCVFDCGVSYCGDLSRSDGGDGMWFDFMSDCGDGFNPSYQVARMLAQPRLAVTCGEKRRSVRVLPRGKFLVIGGDLAYPGPSIDNYETRFFRTFEDALQPPPSFRREAISIEKPALPVRGWKRSFNGSVKMAGVRDASEVERRDSNGRLENYGGPCAFVIPGNHDWFDGLTTYTRLILSRDWLGGWLMPQKRSYFALKLTRGWWLLAFDLSLSQDIDIDQFKFFAKLAQTRLRPTDAVIVVTHEPHWVLDFEKKSTNYKRAESNLHELMDIHLAGMVRLRIAGDLHHYTRHVPVGGQDSMLRKSLPLARSVSVPKREQHIHRCQSTQSVEKRNAPELIVSGGGGAFLHVTHCFSKCISVGTNQQRYVRVCAYPDEKVSYALSWLNIWQFRWRNWRLDIVWAVAYFCIASSLFPLCGIYQDYLAAKSGSTHDPISLLSWVCKKQLALFCEVFSTGRLSAFCAILVIGVFFTITDETIDPRWRVFWGCGHGLVHIFTALLCLLFVETLAEWSIYEGIVKVTSAKNMPKIDNGEGVDLASSLYEEYTTHFSLWIQRMNPFNAIDAVSLDSTVKLKNLETMTAIERINAQALSRIVPILQFFNRVPLLHSILSLFDLPGQIAQRHLDICGILCHKGRECMIRTSALRYQVLDRSTVVSYMAAISLYFAVLAIPLAGNVFGTWLALTLNWFRAQSDAGSSSLRIQHWKNFLRLHIKDDGDLEVFAIGLPRVPKRWKKDPSWDGSTLARRRRIRESLKDLNDNDPIELDAPSWVWGKPSKWIPWRNSKKYTPHLVDYTCISKEPKKRNRLRANSFDGYTMCSSRSMVG